MDIGMGIMIMEGITERAANTTEAGSIIGMASITAGANIITDENSAHT